MYVGGERLLGEKLESIDRDRYRYLGEFRIVLTPRVMQSEGG